MARKSYQAEDTSRFPTLKAKLASTGAQAQTPGHYGNVEREYESLQSPESALATFMNRRAPYQAPTDPYVAERESDIRSGLDSLVPDEDSTDLMFAQDDATKESGDYSFTPSRHDVRSGLMTRLKRGLTLDSREHEQEMDKAALHEQGLNLRARLLGQSNDRPFYQIVQSATGPQVFDARTGQLRDAGIDARPSDNTADFLANSQQILRDFDTVTKKFQPEMVGPIMGRWNSIEQALLGGDPTTTEVYASAARIANQMLKIRSGSQVTDGEMARLASELMDKNQPASTFLGRLQSAQAAVANVYQDRARFSFGRTTTGDVDRMVGGGQPTGGAAPTTPQARPSAADLIAKYGKR